MKCDKNHYMTGALYVHVLLPEGLTDTNDSTMSVCNER